MHESLFGLDSQVDACKKARRRLPSNQYKYRGTSSQLKIFITGYSKKMQTDNVQLLMIMSEYFKAPIHTHPLSPPVISSQDTNMCRQTRCDESNSRGTHGNIRTANQGKLGRTKAGDLD